MAMLVIDPIRENGLTLLPLGEVSIVIVITVSLLKSSRLLPQRQLLTSPLKCSTSALTWVTRNYFVSARHLSP
jgi:hypothetical protein